MNGAEMKAARSALGLDRIAFARLIGYTGTDENDRTRIRRYEHDKQQIPLYIARMVWMLLRWHDMTGQIAGFPEWPGYEFDHAPDQVPT